MTRPPPEKKRKIDSAEDMIFIPVAKCDFEYMNKIAESLQVARHTAKEKEIKELRKRLIRQWVDFIFLAYAQALIATFFV